MDQHLKILKYILEKYTYNLHLIKLVESNLFSLEFRVSNEIISCRWLTYLLISFVSFFLSG